MRQHEEFLHFSRPILRVCRDCSLYHTRNQVHTRMIGCYSYDICDTCAFTSSDSKTVLAKGICCMDRNFWLVTDLMHLGMILTLQVALLLQIGREALPPDIVHKIIDARDRRELAKVALSAPAHGLCLVSVNYDHDLLQPPANCPPVSFGRTHRISKCKLPFY